MAQYAQERTKLDRNHERVPLLFFKKVFCSRAFRRVRAGPYASGSMRVRVKGLSKLPEYNGRLGMIQCEVEGGRLRVVLDQDGKVLSLKRENLVEVQQGQDGHVESNRAEKHMATHQRFSNRDGGGDEQLVLVYNVCAPKGFQRRSTLERGMRDWFDNGEATTNKFVLCGPGGIGKSTLVYTLCVCIQICYVYIQILAPGQIRHDAW